MSRLPDFVIIGAQKAASTQIMRALDAHPDCTLAGDEQHFFRDPYYAESDLAAFADSLPRVDTRRLGIKCPDYLGRPEVAPRLSRDLPDPRLIACLRNPVERAVSAYFWYVRWGVLPLETVDQGLLGLLERRPGTPEFAYQVLTYGLYGRHLQHYLDHVPRRALHVVLHDDLHRDYEGSVSSMLTFLGLAPTSESRPVALRSSAAVANPSVYSPIRLRVLRLRSRYLVERSQAGREVRIVRPTRTWPRLVSNSLAAADRWGLARMVENKRPELSAEVGRRLQDYYADDLTLLGSLLDRDLDDWRDVG